MDKVLDNLSKKIAKKLNVEAAEYVVITYGIHQTILIILNILTVVVLGIIWREMLFIALFFICFAVVRPFAGGYHADTEVNCYLMSVVTLNLILASKYYALFSGTQYLVMGLLAFGITFVLAPVENSQNILDEYEKLVYRRRTREVLVVFIILMFAGRLLHIEVIYSSVSCSLVMVAALVLSGKVKYRRLKRT